jgi:hypothetical protein
LPIYKQSTAPPIERQKTFYIRNLGAISLPHSAVLFSLSTLNYFGRLTDDDCEGFCSKGNNATFDKLMRDFCDTRILFAMGLFR